MTDSKQKCAVVITMARYPNGDAGAVRHHAIAKLLCDGGYKVRVLGYGEYNSQSTQVYDGIEYTSMRTKGSGFFAKVYSRLTHGKRVIKYIKRAFPEVSVIVVDYVRRDEYRRLERYAKRTGCELYHESCEWYSPEEFRKGERATAYKDNDRINTQIIKSPWNVIAISKFLYEHFEGRAKRVVRIPVIMDMTAIESALPQNNDKTVFVYAGSPGRKDYLCAIVDGFLALDEKYRERAELHLIGVTEEALINLSGVSPSKIKALGTSLVAHGRRSREDAVGWVRRADYTVLLRDSRLRYTKAGFPTKVVESLALGTPVVCNISSDLGMYLKDGENAFISESVDASDFSRALARAIDLPYEARCSMSVSARSCAEENFDYRLYLDLF